MNSIRYFVTDGGGHIRFIFADDVPPDVIKDATLSLLRGRAIDLETADVATIARLALADWPKMTEQGKPGLFGETVRHPAHAYLEPMLSMRGLTADDIPGATYGRDRVADVINGFLSNAGQWRGEAARAVKARLKVMAAKR